MKRLLLAVLFGFSLSACAQPAATPQKVTPATDAATPKEPSFAAGTFRFVPGKDVDVVGER